MRPIAAASLAALALGGCGPRGADDAQASAIAPAYIQAHTIQQMMANVVQPTADVYWQSVQTISDETGTHDIKPETDADWLRVRTSAASLTEYGNLLMSPVYAEGRGKDWMDFAKGLVEIGMQAEQAAVAKDPEKVFEVGGNLYNVCSGCHQLYPPAAAPAAAPSAPASEGAASEGGPQ